MKMSRLGGFFGFMLRSPCDYVLVSNAQIKSTVYRAEDEKWVFAQGVERTLMLVLQ